MENSGAGEITINQQPQNIEDVKVFLENNDTENAKNFLANFLNADPNHSQANFIMAQLYESEGNFKESADCYEKVFAEAIPAEFLERVIYVYENADKYDNLYAIYKAQFEQNSNDMDICERLANTSFILNKQDEAIELYNKLLTKQPENPIALRQLSDIYENTNPMMFRLIEAKMAEIDNNLEKAEKEYKKAFTLAEKEEDILQIRYKLAQLYRKLEKNDQALDEYIYILSATEENFSVFMELADIYLEMNNSSAAINILKRALHIYPDNKEAMQTIADTYLELGDFDKAQNYFERLVELDSKNIENKINLAKVYLQLEKLEETKNILLEAEKQDANNTEVLTAMAGYNTFVKDFNKAKTYCERIIQKLPKSPLGYRKIAQLYEAMDKNYLAHYNYALYHELKNEPEEAIGEYLAVIREKKNDFEAIQKLATLYEKLEEFDSALEYYHILFVAKVNLVETTKKITSIYFKTQEYDLAQKYIEEALESDKNVELIYPKALCEYYLKDFESALENMIYYKENTNSLENTEDADKIIEEIEKRNDPSNNFLHKIWQFIKSLFKI